MITLFDALYKFRFFHVSSVYCILILFCFSKTPLEFSCFLLQYNAVALSESEQVFVLVLWQLWSAMSLWQSWDPV